MLFLVFVVFLAVVKYILKEVDKIFIGRHDVSVYPHFLILGALSHDMFQIISWSVSGFIRVLTIKYDVVGAGGARERHVSGSILIREMASHTIYHMAGNSELESCSFKIQFTKIIFSFKWFFGKFIMIYLFVSL